MAERALAGLTIIEPPTSRKENKKNSIPLACMRELHVLLTPESAKGLPAGQSAVITGRGGNDEHESRSLQHFF
jgi:hypothetical protein